MKNLLTTVPIFLIGVVVVLLMVENRAPVVLNLIPLQYELVVPIYLVFFMGLFLGLLLSSIILLTRKIQAQVNLHIANKENTRLRNQCKALEGEFDKKKNAHLAGAGEPNIESPERALAKN